MILRRFTQHIKEQNWFAVGLDVIVVIVGIFLGMQVDEWNKSIEDHVRDKRAVKLFAEELDTMIDRAQDDVNATRKFVVMYDQLLGIFSDCDSISNHADFISESINRPRGLREINIMRAGLDAVAQPSVLARLKNPELTRSVSRVMELIDFWNIRHSNIAPELVNNYREIIKHFTISGSRELKVEGTAIISGKVEPIYSVDPEKLCENQEFMHLLLNQSRYHQSVYTPFILWTTSLENARKATENILGVH